MDNQELLELIENSATPNNTLKDALFYSNPADVSELFNTLDNASIFRVFHLLSKDMAAEVFSDLDGEKQEHLLRVMTDRQVANIVNEMFADDATDLLREMPANLVKKLLANADEETRRDVNLLLAYPESSAGSIMTTEFVKLNKEMNVSEVFGVIRRTGLLKETVYTCYVTDSSRRLEGVVSVKDLLLADGDALVEDVMDDNVIYCQTSDDRETAAELIQKYDFMSLPVVDSEKRLVGIVTFDDIMSVIREENTEDIQKMNAILPGGESYLKTGAVKFASRCITWLLGLLVSGIFTGLILKGVTPYLPLILISSLPMLMDSSGNAGAQSSTMIIRGIALNEISGSDVPKILFKEVRIGLICGACMIPLTLLKVTLIDGGTIFVALTVALTIVSAVVIAKALGSMLPFAAKAIKLDPAVMASPLITSIADMCTLVIYFVFAIVLL
jgi:magnesium transporter